MDSLVEDREGLGCSEERRERQRKKRDDAVRRTEKDDSMHAGERLTREGKKGKERKKKEKKEEKVEMKSYGCWTSLKCIDTSGMSSLS